jgi:hypothetical protein
LLLLKHSNLQVQQTATTQADNGFYLRDLIDDFRSHNNSEFLKISDIDYLQILAVINKSQCSKQRS